MRGKARAALLLLPFLLLMAVFGILVAYLIFIPLRKQKSMIFTIMATIMFGKVIMEGAWDNRKGVETLMKYNLEGKFPVEKLITYYDFEDIGKALDDLEHQRVIKAVLKMPEE